MKKALLTRGYAFLTFFSFGEGVNLLHPFTEQFTSHSGARLLQYFTFEQKKTRIAQVRFTQHGNISLQK